MLTLNKFFQTSKYYKMTAYALKFTFVETTVGESSIIIFFSIILIISINKN